MVGGADDSKFKKVDREECQHNATTHVCSHKNNTNCYQLPCVSQAPDSQPTTNSSAHSQRCLEDAAGTSARPATAAG